MVVSVRIIFVFFAYIVEAAKLRNWMGPANFLGGPIPISRLGHVLISYNDSKILIFGGTNAFYGVQSSIFRFHNREYLL